MKIVTNTISQIGGYPGDFVNEISYRDINKANAMICKFLAEAGYRFIGGVNMLRPHIYSETYFDPKRIIFIESRAKYPGQERNSLLEAMIAARPEELEGIVFAVREASELPIGLWRNSNPIEYEVSDDFNFLKHPNFSSLKDELEIVAVGNCTDTAIIKRKLITPR